MPCENSRAIQSCVCVTWKEEVQSSSDVWCAAVAGTQHGTTVTQQKSKGTRMEGDRAFMQGNPAA
jgi:hypothetical protein